MRTDGPLLARAEAWGRWLENALLTLLLAGLITLAVGQILLRNLFSIGFPWIDGVIHLGVLWLAVIAAVVATREQRHIAINLAPRLLPPAWHRPVAGVANGFAAGVCGVLAWYSWAFVSDAREFGDVLLGTQPAWVLELILPIGFVLMAYRFGLRALATLFGAER
jgi:TRAP-type C4-dicarboxylate transport system permease small subunit